MGGPLTAGGRVRRAFSAWLLATDRLERGLRLVGLKRTAHDAPRTFAEALRAATRRADDDDGPDDGGEAA